MDLKEIRKQAELEIEQERFRTEVEKYKTTLRNKKSIWDIVFPYKILIVKKER